MPSHSWAAHQGHAHSKDPVIQLVAVQLPQARHQGREFRDTLVDVVDGGFYTYLHTCMHMYLQIYIYIYNIFPKKITHTHIYIYLQNYMFTY